MSKKILIATGGGDCPGLNAVIRGIVKSAAQEEDWQVFGSIESFNGVLKDNVEIVELTEKSVREGSAPQKVPDFTRGAWERREPIGIESLDLARMDIASIRPLKA